MSAISHSFASNMTARVRGMKSALFTPPELEALLDKNDADAVAQTLLSSPYAEDMAESMTRYRGADAVEDAVSRNLVETFAQLRALSRGRYEELVRIFFSRWDLIAVKSLLRNLHHGQGAAPGELSLVPGPSLPVPLLKEFSSQTTMEALVRGLAGWNPRLCSVLLEALPEYQKSGDLRVLEEALDRNYFLGNVRRLSGYTDSDSRFLTGLLRMEIDRINLRILFAARGPASSPEEGLEWLLPRGNISVAELRNIAGTGSPERAVEALAKTPYVEYAESLAQSGSFRGFDRQLELAILHRLKRASLHQGIGIAVLMHYAWLKYNEVMNLRMIVRGVDIHLAPERIREELVYV